jgi:hypothetical protein
MGRFQPAFFFKLKHQPVAPGNRRQHPPAGIGKALHYLGIEVAAHDGETGLAGNGMGETRL